MKLLRAFGLLGGMDQPKFQEFTLPGNAVGQVLLAHFLALELVMATKIDYEWTKHRKGGSKYQCVVQWVLRIRDEMPSSMQEFIAWPANISTIVLEEMKGERPPSPWFQGITRKEK
jgi:hypothetical protein